jgi:hypothetical protein
VNRDLLWKILEKIGVPPKMVAAVAALHEGMRGNVKVNGESGEMFDILLGLRQGCVLSTTLFNIFFTCVLKMMKNKLIERLAREEGEEVPVEDQVGVKISFRKDERGANLWADRITKIAKTKRVLAAIEAALFADDAAFMTQGGEEELQLLMSTFDEAANAFGLTVSAPKTKVLATKPCGNIRVGGVTLEQVDVFKYLGAKATADGSSRPEVQARIGGGCGAMREHKRFF